MLPLVRKALATEANAGVEGAAGADAATSNLKAEDRATRLAAVQQFASARNSNTKTLLIDFLNKEKDGGPQERGAQEPASDRRAGSPWGERVGVASRA